MEDIVLKRKVTLRTKENFAFTFTGRLKLKMTWSVGRDLDLCLFYKTKEGCEGGVFSDDYRKRKSDLGALSRFPFIFHRGDKSKPVENQEDRQAAKQFETLGQECGAEGAEKPVSTEEAEEMAEEIYVAGLNDMQEAYVCVINYDAVENKRSVTFSEESCRVELISDAGDYLEVLADSPEQGHVYWVCTIKNRNGDFALKEEGKVLDVSAAFATIPGFSLICNA